MLVLTRKVGEKIHLGNDIVVTVTSISGQQVRLGITAPPEVSILRNELIVRAQASGQLPAAARPEVDLPAGDKRARPLRMFRPRTQEPV
jgi:carbon storage regulator